MMVISMTEGNPLGPSPNTGISPDFSLAKPVKILQVGKVVPNPFNEIII